MGSQYSTAHIARLLAVAITDRLAEFGAEIPLAEAEETAFKWVSSMQETSANTLSIIASSTETLEELAGEIVFTILMDLAEERPGTNPWSHERTIPMPIAVAYSQLRLLAAITQAALFNEDYRWAENANANLLALSALFTETNKKPNLLNSNTPMMFVPQPAMAYVARFFRNTEKKIQDKEWLISARDFADPDNFPNLLASHADILLSLTHEFGRPLNPNN